MNCKLTTSYRDCHATLLIPENQCTGTATTADTYCAQTCFARVSFYTDHPWWGWWGYPMLSCFAAGLHDRSSPFSWLFCGSGTAWKLLHNGCLHIMASGLDHNTIIDDPLWYACQYWCHHFSARLSSGRWVLSPSHQLGLEVKDLVEKLMDGWLRGLGYIIWDMVTMWRKCKRCYFQHACNWKWSAFHPALHYWVSDIISDIQNIQGISGQSKQMLDRFERLNKVLSVCDLIIMARQTDCDWLGINWQDVSGYGIRSNFYSY